MNNDHDIKVLNSLVETTLDSAEGYAEAAKDAKSAQLVSLFQGRAGERRRRICRRCLCPCRDRQRRSRRSSKRRGTIAEGSARRR